MTTPNFVETPSPQSLPARSRRPADYYSGPSPERAFPLWVSFGCGGAALLIMLIVFAGGAWMAGGGFKDVMDLSLGMTVGQMGGMYQKDVTEEQRKAIKTEIDAVRKSFTEDKVTAAGLNPLLQTIARVTGDEKVNAAEASEILETARRINEKAKP